MAFLNDILKYLNALSAELQGEEKLICDLIQSVTVYHRKLNILNETWNKKNSSVFPQFLHTKIILKLFNTEIF